MSQPTDPTWKVCPPVKHGFFFSWPKRILLLKDYKPSPSDLFKIWVKEQTFPEAFTEYTE